jgi:hypothetical protein
MNFDNPFSKKRLFLAALSYFVIRAVPIALLALGVFVGLRYMNAAKWVQLLCAGLFYIWLWYTWYMGYAYAVGVRTPKHPFFLIVQISTDRMEFVWIKAIPFAGLCFLEGAMYFLL